MSPKDLVKLAKACRSVGIKTYKDSDVEFTLTDELVSTRVTKRTQKAEMSAISNNLVEDAFKSDALTDEQLLFYSVANVDEIGGSN